MKKIFSIMLCMVMLLSSCGNKKEKHRETVYPSELITIEELSAYVGYTPVMNEEGNRRERVATYVSEPLGKGDIVRISVRQKSQFQSEKEVKDNFENVIKLRSDAYEIGELGVKAYVVYPSLHYYIDGYHIEVTAGSGSNDLQKALLTNISKITLNNLSKITGIKLPK